MVVVVNDSLWQSSMAGIVNFAKGRRSQRRPMIIKLVIFVTYIEIIII